MAFQVSPGINVSEINLTTTVGKGISTSTGAFAGNFKWGPVEERVLISSEVELVKNTLDKLFEFNGKITKSPNTLVCEAFGIKGIAYTKK